jgi:hypothetical protein
MARKVKETWVTNIRHSDAGLLVLDETYLEKSSGFKNGDRVRITVEKLERKPCPKSVSVKRTRMN